MAECRTRTCNQSSNPGRCLEDKDHTAGKECCSYNLHSHRQLPYIQSGNCPKRKPNMNLPFALSQEDTPFSTAPLPLLPRDKRSFLQNIRLRYLLRMEGSSFMACTVFAKKGSDFAVSREPPSPTGSSLETWRQKIHCRIAWRSIHRYTAPDFPGQAVRMRPGRLGDGRRGQAVVGIAEAGGCPPAPAR